MSNIVGVKRWANRLRPLLSMSDHRWRTVAWVIGPLILLALILLGYSYSWTGFGAYVGTKSDKVEYVRPKTLWDWMQLVLIPFVVAFGVWWLNRRREDLSREFEEARTREERLQNYFDRMTELMLDKGLRSSEPGAEVRDIARARTLTVLRGLDGERKAALLQFLFEADLIKTDKQVIILSKADLREADLREADLIEANLSGADLSGADLSGANLGRADLGGENYGRAIEIMTNLREVDLSDAFLRGADLRGADLNGANLRGADLIGAALGAAELIGANLRAADLRGVDFGWVNLREADLSDADLRGADLSGAKNLTQKQLVSARGDGATSLPEGLVRPESWGEAAVG